MNFNKNQKEFPTSAHYNAWCSGVLVLPIEITLPDYIRNNFGETLTESCEQMQSFMLDLLWDMYDHADTENPCPKQISNILKDLVNIGELKGDDLIIPYLAWDKYIKKAERSKPFKEDEKYGLTFTKRLANLERVGAIINKNNNHIAISNSKYPDMFYAMKKMAQVALKEKATGDNSFTYCDFRKLCKSYKTDYYINALSFLNDESLEIAEQMETLSKELHLTRVRSIGFYKEFCFDYFYKKHHILRAFCGFSSYYGNNETTNIKIHCFTPYQAKNPETINDSFFDLLEKESDEFKKYYLKTMKRCTRCNPNCPTLGVPVCIFGKLNRVCNGWGIVTETCLNIADMPYIETIIRNRVKAIDNI